MKHGDRVLVTVYGEPRSGTFCRMGWQGNDNGGSIAFVLMDDTQQVKWFHAESVEVLKTYRVTGVFVSSPWNPQPIERVVEAPRPEYAIALVNCEAQRQELLFLSAKAEEV